GAGAPVRRPGRAFERRQRYSFALVTRRERSSMRSVNSLIRMGQAVMPWHFLYFLPEPQGHGAFRGIFDPEAWSPPTAAAAEASSPWVAWTRWGRGRAGSSWRTSSMR